MDMYAEENLALNSPGVWLSVNIYVCTYVPVSITTSNYSGNVDGTFLLHTSHHIETKALRCLVKEKTVILPTISA